MTDLVAVAAKLFQNGLDPGTPVWNAINGRRVLLSLPPDEASQTLQLLEENLDVAGNCIEAISRLMRGLDYASLAPSYDAFEWVQNVLDAAERYESLLDHAQAPERDGWVDE